MSWSSTLVSIAGVAIPIVAIVGGIAFGMFSLYLKVRRQREMLQLYHAERMAAIEKGIELPPLSPGMLCEGYYGAPASAGHRRGRSGRGITLLFVGIAITLALWQTGGDHSFWWGLVIVALGLAQIVRGFLEPRDPAATASGGEPAPGGRPGDRSG